MRHLEEFRDARLVGDLAAEIRKRLGRKRPTFMEVCGTHTMAMFRHGLRDLLGDSLDLLSGPGCPVCVTPAGYLDQAIAIAREHNVTIATFGDMVRVPGSKTSLEKERAKGCLVRVVYSPLDALSLSGRGDGCKVVFLGVGFETTAPTIASSILEAERTGTDEFYVLSAHKRIPPALEAIARDPGIHIDGFLCPGHVSVITGSTAYEGVAREHGIPCVVTGFEPLDVMSGIHMLVEQYLEGEARVENAYTRAVRPEGNPRALSLLHQVFRVDDSEWRGLGRIPESGYSLREEYSHRDAAKQFPVETAPAVENRACRCGEVLAGKIRPLECPLFMKTCTPEFPVGPCMVSSEGSCAAYYKYRGHA
jgi:hydrogenase expression/formation protein HypD